MSNNELRIEIIGSLNEQQSITDINSQLRTIEKKLNLQLGIDTTQLNNIASQVKQIQDKINQGSKGIKIIDDKDLFDSINKNKQLFTSIEQAKNAYKSFGDIKIKKVFDPYTQELSSFNMEIRRTDGLIENLKFELAKLKDMHGVNGFLLTKKTETDNREIQMQKQLQQTMVDRQNEQKKLTDLQSQAINKSIDQSQKELQNKKELSKEIERQLSLFQRQKQIESDNLKRKLGSTVDNTSLRSTNSKVNNIDPSTFSSLKQLKDWQSEINLGFKEIGSQARASSSNVLGFGEALQTAMVRFPIWMAASTAFYQSLNYFVDGIQYVNDLNKSLTEIAIVTNQSQSQVAALGQEYNKVAQDMGVTTQNIAEASVEFYRQGLSQAEVMERVATATQYAKISSLEFNDASEILTATVNSMGVDIDRVSDVYSYLGDATATGADEIGQAFQRVGGTAGALGIEFEKAASWVAVLSSRTREGAGTIGNSIKSILARVQNLQENGFDETDGTKINDVAKALATVDIALVDSTGQFRNFGTVMDELGANWENMDSRTKAYVATTVAGSYQQSRFLNIMEGYKDTIPLYEQSLNSAGTTQQKFGTYLESNEAALNKLKATWESVWQKSFDSEAIRTGIGLLDGLASGLEFVIDNVGLIPTVTGLAVAGFLLFNNTTRTSILQQGVLSSSLVKTGDSMLITSGASRALQVSLYNTTLAARGASSVFATLGTVGKSSLAFLGATALPIAGFMALSFAISKLTENMMEAKAAEEEIKNQQDQMMSNYKNRKDDIGELVSEYERLSEAQKNGDLNTEDEETYVKLQNELGQILPTVVEGIDSKGNSIVASSDKIREQIGVLEELISLEKDKKRLDAPSEIEKGYSKIDALKEELEYQNKVAQGYRDGLKEMKSNPETSSSEILAVEQKIAEWQLKRQLTLTQINAEMGKNADNYKVFFEDLKVNPDVKNDIADLMSTFNLEGKKIGEIEGIVVSTTNAIGKLNKAMDSGDSKGITSAKNELEGIINAYGDGKISVKDFSDALSESKSKNKEASDAQKELKEITDMTTEEVIENAIANSKSAESLEDTEKAAEEASASYAKYSDELANSIDMQNQNASASEMLAGITSSQIDKIYEQVSVYQLLSKQENLNEQQKLMLADATNFLAGIYPYLVQGSEANIDAILRETKANDILLEAVNMAAKGQLSSQENQTLNSALGAKSRIEVIKAEIIAVEEMVQAYKDAAVKTYNEAVKIGNELGTLEAEKSYKRADAMGESRTSNLNSELDKLIPKFEKYTGSLGKSIDYQGRASEAQDKSARSTDKNNKAKEKAIDATEDYVFIQSKLNKELEKNNILLEDNSAQLSKYAKNSREYRKSLEKDIKLLKERNKIIDKGIKSIDAQIKADKYITEGVVSSDEAVSDTFYGNTNTSNSSSKKATGAYSKQINSAASKYKVDAQLVKAVAIQESQLGKLSKNVMQVTSDKSAKQTGTTAERSIKAGAKYLSEMLDKAGGNLKKALAAYNMGEGILSYFNKHGGYSVKNMKAFSAMMKKRLGSNVYGDPYYVDKILKNYPASTKKSTGATRSSVSNTKGRVSSSDVASYYMDGFYITDGFNARGGSHKGIDLNKKGTTGNGDTGTLIKNIASGTVETIFKNNRTAGNAVIVRGDDGKLYQYNHLHKAPTLKQGQRISAGDKIGLLGNTGASQGAHLDLKIKDSKGNYIDPEKYLKKLAKDSSGTIELVDSSGSTNRKTIKKGSTGSDVKALQKALGLKVDGKFNKATEKAVKAYQKKNGLTADGVVGADTWNKINKKISDSNKKEAENKQNKADAKSEKADLKQEKNKNNQEIQDAFVAIGESWALATNKEVKLQLKADSKRQKAEENGVTSKKGRAYLKEENKELKKLEKEQKARLKELQKYYQKNKDSMSQATRAEWNKLVPELQADILATQEAQQASLLDFFQATSDAYDKEADALQKKADAKRDKAGKFDPTSQKYRDYLKEEDQLLDKVEKKQKNKIKNLKAYYKKNKADMDQATRDSINALVDEAAVKLKETQDAQHEIVMETVQSSIGGYDKVVEKFQNDLESLRLDAQKIDPHSKAYRENLTKQLELQKKIKKEIQDKIAYTEKQLKKNKELTDAEKKQLETDLAGYKNDAKQAGLEVSETAQQVNQSHLDKYDERIALLDKKISLKQSELNRLDDDTSAEYKKNLQEQIALEKQKEIQLLRKKKHIENEIANNKDLSKAYKTELTASLVDVNIELEGIVSNIETLDGSIVEFEIRVQDKSIDKAISKIDFISYKMSLLSEDAGLNIKAGLFEEMQAELKNVNTELEAAIQNTLSLRTEAGIQGKDTTGYDERLKALIQQRQSNIQSMQSNYQDMLSNVEEAKNKMEEAESEALEKASKDFSKLLDDSEKRITDYQKAIDKFANRMELLETTDFQERQTLLGNSLLSNKNKASQIIEEFNKLSNTPVYSEDDASTLKAQLEQLQQDLVDTNMQTIEFVKTLEQVKFDSLISGAKLADTEIQRLTSRLRSNMDLLDGGLLSGTDLDFNFAIPQGSTLKLSSLINDPIADVKVTEAKVQDIKASSYGEQIKLAEDLYNTLKAQSEKYHAILIETEISFSNDIEKLKDESDKKIAEAKAKKDKEALAEQERVQAIEKAKLEQHYKDLETVMNDGLSNFRKGLGSKWDEILSLLDQKLAEASNKQAAILSLTEKVGEKLASPPQPGVTIAPKVNLPKYAKGTDGHPGGLAIVSEQGKEMLVLPNGRVALTNDAGSELMDLPKGTHVIPNKKTEDILKGKGVPAYASGTNLDDDQAWYEFLLRTDPKAAEKMKESITVKPPTSSPNSPSTTKPTGDNISDWNDSYKGSTGGSKTGFWANYDFLSNGQGGGKNVWVDSETGALRWADIKFDGKGEYVSSDYGEHLTADDAKKLADLFKGYQFSIDEAGKAYYVGMSEFGKENYKNSTGSYPDDIDTQIGIINKEINDLLNGSPSTGGNTGSNKNNLPSLTKTNPLVYSDDFIKKYDPYSKDGSKYEKDRQIKNKAIQDLQAKLDEIEESGNQDEIQDLTGQILSKQQEVAKEDINFLIESMNDLSQQREKNAREIRESLIKELQTTDMTEDMRKQYQESIMEQDDIIATSIKERKSLIKELFDYEQGLREKALTQIKNYQDRIQFEMDMQEYINPSDMAKSIKLYEDMIKRAKQYSDELNKQKSLLEGQMLQYEVGSYEWNLLNEQVSNYTSQLKDATLEQARLQKELVQKQFDAQISAIEKSLFNGSTSEETQEAFDAKVKAQQTYVDGLEKELLTSKLLSFVRENDLTLSKEELELLNSKDKIERESLERLEKQLDIRRLEIKLANLKNQKSIQQLAKKEDGTWDFMYVADQEAINQTEQELKDRQLDLIKWEQDVANTAESDAISDKNKYLEKIRNITQKALNGEYSSYGEFASAMANLNNNFLVNMNSDTKTYWESMMTTVQSNLQSMIASYKNYVDQIIALAEQAEMAKSSPIEIDTSNASIISGGKDYSGKEFRKLSSEEKKEILKDPNGYINVSGKKVSFDDALTLSDKQLQDKYGFETGGYTGNFGKQGKLAFLHEKELILNKVDTENILNAVKLSRQLNTKLPDFSRMYSKPKETTQQIFQISELVFPNVKSSNDIQNAIKNLPTMAFVKTREQ